MIENNPTDVSAALELLPEKLEPEAGLAAGSKSSESRDYDRAREALERVGLLAALRDEGAGLGKELEALAATEPEEDDEAQAPRRSAGRAYDGQGRFAEAGLTRWCLGSDQGRAEGAGMSDLRSNQTKRVRRDWR